MLNEIVKEETMENVVEDVTVDVAETGIAGKVLKGAIVAGVVTVVAVGAVTLYKKVIKPKFKARKALPENAQETETVEEA